MDLFFGYYLTAASAVPITFIPMVNSAVLFVKLLAVVGVGLPMNLHLVGGVVLLVLTVKYFVEGRGGVNVFLVREGWLMGG